MKNDFHKQIIDVQGKHQCGGQLDMRPYEVNLTYKELQCFHERKVGRKVFQKGKEHKKKLGIMWSRHPRKWSPCSSGEVVYRQCFKLLQGEGEVMNIYGGHTMIHAVMK